MVYCIIKDQRCFSEVEVNVMKEGKVEGQGFVGVGGG